MRYLLWFLIFIMSVIAVLCLVDKSLGGTIEELYAIAEKYMENPIVLQDHGDHICVFVFNKEKTEIVAVDVRTPDLKVCLYFFELVDGEMKLVWTNPGIEEMQRKEKAKNQV